MKKLLSYVAIVFTCVLFISSVSALEQPSIINKNDSCNNIDAGVTVNSDSKSYVVTVNSADLKMVKEQSNIGRYKDAAWIGVKVVAPKDVEITTLQNATYKSGNSANKSFWSNQDTPATDQESQDKEHFIYVYGAITEDILTKATASDTMITYTWTFDWDNNGGVDQTVTIKIDPSGVTLKAKDDDTVLWDSSKYNEVKQEAEKKPTQSSTSTQSSKTETTESKVAEVVSVEGTNVSVSGTTLEESNTTYKQMLEKVTEKGYKTVFGAYELTTVSSIGEEGITLVFKVGTNNNGKAAYVLHQKKDGTFEEFNEVVKDGLVKITVKELSPFMIALGSVVKDDDMPKTSDIFPQVIVGLMALGLAGTYTYKKLHE